MKAPAAVRTSAAGIALLAWILFAAPLRAAEADLHGPLSDFWARVKRDWADRLTSLNRGPLQTAIWVGMVWDGPDDIAIDRLVDELQERETRRWVRSQITKHRWSEIQGRNLHRMLALRQNIILLGTPEDNDLVARALRQTPLHVESGAVSVEGRRRGGPGLLVIALTPNPLHPDFYALVMTGTSPEAVLRAGDVPYGDSDYVIYRGRRLLEQGRFAWKGGKPDRDHLDVSVPFTEHFNWQLYVVGRFRLHYDPAASDPAAIRRIGESLDAEITHLADYYGIDRSGIDPIDCYLYASLDEKVNQTADSRRAHLDRPSDTIHALQPQDPGRIGSHLSALTAAVLLRRSKSWGRDAERELPGLALAVSLAGRDRFETIPLQQWAARSRRDVSYMPIDVLLAREPEEIEELMALDAAAFVRDLIEREGTEAVARFFRSAGRSDFHRRFREIFGITLKEAERRWLLGLPGTAGGTAARSTRAQAEPRRSPDETPEMPVALAAFEYRDHAAAERLFRSMPATPETLTLLARIEFRTGRFDRAVATAAAALALPGGRATERAWARLTSGRAHAMAGRLLAATLELTAGEILAGPEPVRILADFWLERLGQPLNRRAANAILMQEAEAHLQNFEWEEAERKLRDVLASDPRNREAHASLGQVYLSKYQYWYDWMLLDLELFPGYSSADPQIYKFLADKGRRELRMAAQLPFGEEDRWLTEAGPVDPGADQAASHFLLGRVQFLKGNLDAARREMETALSLERRRSSLAAYCHLYLGRIAVAEGNEAAARGEFETVLAMKAGAQVTKRAARELESLGRAGGGAK